MLCVCRYILASLLLTLLTLAHAADRTTHAAPDIEITATDGNTLTLRHYPAHGTYLVIWIDGGHGLSERDLSLASALSRRGVEIWQIDFAQSLFQLGGSNFMRNVDPQYVVELINAAQKRTGKKVLLLSYSYGAVPALRGATLWQKQAQHPGRLVGVILLSPDLYASIPELGLPPDYLPIVRSTNLPLMIFQAGKRGNAGQFPNLLRELGSSNDKVFFKILPRVTSPMYSEDTSAATRRHLRQLPGELAVIIPLLDSVTPPARAPDYQFVRRQHASLDTQLKPFKGQPQPPPIALQDIDRQAVNINDYHGQVTVINFWASWCRPCREEIPSLNRLRARLHNRPFRLISVNYAENADTVRDFLKRVKVDYPVLLDSNGRISTDWNVIAFPSTFVVGSDGKIHYGVNAAIAWDTPEVVSKLEDLMPVKLSRNSR